MKHFSFPVRVYYEDTDAAGIVYYANYLKFAERARTEWLRKIGFEQETLWAEAGLGFVVAHLEVDFKNPARLDDLVSIETSLQQHSKVHMTMRQILKKGDATLVNLSVKIACVDKNGKPARIPEQLLHALVK